MIKKAIVLGLDKDWLWSKPDALLALHTLFTSLRRLIPSEIASSCRRMGVIHHLMLIVCMNPHPFFSRWGDSGLYVKSKFQTMPVSSLVSSLDDYNDATCFE